MTDTERLPGLDAVPRSHVHREHLARVLTRRALEACS